MKKTICKQLCLFLMLVLMLFPAVCPAEGSLEEPSPGEFEGGGLAVLAAALDQGESLSPGIAAEGSHLWHFEGTNIACIDAASGETLASLPLRKLTGRDEAEYAWLVAYQEKAFLCTAYYEPKAQVKLFPIILSENQIAAGEVQDLSDDLAFLLNETYYEIDLLATDNALCFCALDEEMCFSIFLYTPEDGSLRELPKQPLALCDAIIPYGNDLLTAGTSLEEDNAIDLMLLKETGEESTLLATIPTGSMDKALNYAYDAESEKLYFTQGQNVRSVLLASGQEPKILAVLSETLGENRLGAISSGQYCLLSEDGELLQVSLSVQLNALRLNIANMEDCEGFSGAVSAYNSKHPDVFIAVSEGGDATELLNAMITGSADKDAYIIALGSDSYKTLYQRGYLTDMSGSTALVQAASAMPAAIRERIFSGGKLLALPLQSEACCLAIHEKGFEELTGLSKEELPSDWAGFLKLLAELADSGVLADSETWMLSDNNESAEEFHETILAWILNDAFLYMEQNDENLNKLSSLLQPILAAYEAVDWNGLGLTEEANMEFSRLGEEIRLPLITEQYPVIETSTLSSDYVFRPLSLAKDGSGLIRQELAVLVINPYSSHKEELLSFAEELWQSWPLLTRMALCEDLNEPVRNETYDEDIAFFESMVPAYEAAIASAANSMERQMLQAELDELLAFMEDYRANAYWSASEESIAAYRALMPSFLPAPDEFWNIDGENSAVRQYLDGSMSGSRFIQQLVSELKMSRLKNE